MDSPTSFVNLLTSQQDKSYTFPETIDLGSSEIPRFSSQGSDDPNLTGEDGNRSGHRRRLWTPKEDVVLISAWLNTSKDPVVGNEQKAGAFWFRIQEYFNNTLGLTGENSKPKSTCKQRWGRLNDQVCKFVGCYEAALKDQRSGQSENDIMKAAHDIFFNDHGVKFTLDHAWRELRHDQKWCSESLTKDIDKAKRRKTCESSDEPSTINLEEEVPEARPIGVKAAKAKAKKPTAGNEKGKPVVDIGGILEMKAKDMELRNKLSNKRLLEFLLGKKESLTEVEEALKNKLINELLE
ncbi:glutathione S-transferase T3-like [Eutrema salsugineum]|uniref:glutathione S-transferase T3-like n=1 Tax=Eutrema salsugineum TaxID=72664 RepID=UPI000CED2C64|nr:glutathione S-transferase T3-like [Eutrema salsugineum]